MSTTTLRFYNLTVSFLPQRRSRHLLNFKQILRLYASRRRLKQSIRGLFTRSVAS